MRRTFLILICVGCLASPALSTEFPAGQHTSNHRSAPQAGQFEQVLAVQVALDRRGFSPGEIDGRSGANTRRAIEAFQSASGLSPSGEADKATLAALASEMLQPLTKYTITEQDVAGPFIKSVPDDMMEESKLPALGYTAPLEGLAEKFHSSSALMSRLNPGAGWGDHRYPECRAVLATGPTRGAGIRKPASSRHCDHGIRNDREADGSRCLRQRGDGCSRHHWQ